MRVEIGKAEFLAVGEARKVMLWHTLGFKKKKRIFDDSGFFSSAEWVLDGLAVRSWTKQTHGPAPLLLETSENIIILPSSLRRCLGAS